MTDETPTTHGGFRPGAGAKPKNDVQERAIKVRFTDAELAVVKDTLPKNTRERSLLILDLALAASEPVVQFQAQDVAADFVGQVEINGNKYFLIAQD